LSLTTCPFSPSLRFCCTCTAFLLANLLLTDDEIMSRVHARHNSVAIKRKKSHITSDIICSKDENGMTFDRPVFITPKNHSVTYRLYCLYGRSRKPSRAEIRSSPAFRILVSVFLTLMRNTLLVMMRVAEAEMHICRNQHSAANLPYINLGVVMNIRLLIIINDFLAQ
jgi:hypothetical protein